MNKYALRQTPLTVVIGSVLAGGSVTAHANTITVNIIADAPVGTLPGACTLRSAVASANAGASLDACDAGTTGADEIVFAPGLANSTVTLSEGQMEITGALTITGPSPDDPSGMTIDGDDASRIFRIVGGESGEFEIALHAMTLTGGRSDPYQRGGAVYATDASLVLDHVVVKESHSYYPGGGLSVSRGNVMLINSTISVNSVLSFDNAAGGGIRVALGNLTVINSTISQNSVSAYDGASGGGLSVSRGDVMLINSTISGNSVSDSGFFGGRGGGLTVNTGDVTLSQSTVAYNTAGRTHGIQLFGSSSLTLYNSLIVQADADQTACNQTADKHLNTLVTDSSCTGIAALPAVIDLGPLADNGGATRTHALNPGSAAIDAAGDCAAQFGITEDQRGAPRPIDGNASGTAECDIGAYEFQDILFRDRFEWP